MMLSNLALLHKPTSISLESERLLLRLPVIDDWMAWYYIRERSRSFLEPWEPTWPASRLTKEIYIARLKNFYKKQQLGLGYYYHIFLKDNKELVGGINLLHIIRAAVQCASLGYWIGQEFHSNGFMTEAVQTVLPHAFKTLQLHRIQASCLPNNIPSQKVLRKNNFVEECVARKYAKIQSEWKDHIIFSLNYEDWLTKSGGTEDTGQLLRIDT